MFKGRTGLIWPLQSFPQFLVPHEKLSICWSVGKKWRCHTNVDVFRSLLIIHTSQKLFVLVDHKAIIAFNQCDQWISHLRRACCQDLQRDVTIMSNCYLIDIFLIATVWELYLLRSKAACTVPLVWNFF